MSDLTIAACVTTAVAVLVVAMLIRQIAPKRSFVWLALMCLDGVFASPIVYYFVRLPIKSQVESRLGIQQWKEGTAAFWHDVIQLSYAPLTEEPAKLIPWILMLVIGVRLLPTKKLVVPIAMSLGLGFALGEIWLVRELIAGDPKLVGLRWYQLGGFMSERLMTAFTHSLFALPTIWLSRKGVGYALLGLLIGMTLHFCGNAPIVMMHRELFGLSKNVWSVIVQIWLIAYVFIALVLFVWFHYGDGLLKQIWQAKMICPECGATYRQPLFMAMNMGTWRYEQCGACKKWHWVNLSNLAPLEKKKTVQI